MKRSDIKQLWLQAGGESSNENSFHDEVIHRFSDLIVDACADSVIDSDPSVKMILHEPYRTVMDNVMRTFEDDNDQN